MAGSNRAEDLLLSPEQSLNKPDKITAAEVQEDLELLTRALRKGYAGPDFTRDLRKITPQASTPLEFCTRLAKIFAGVRDAHLRASLDFRACGSAAAKGEVGDNVAPADTWVFKIVRGTGVLALPTFWPRADEHWNGFLDQVKKLRAENRPFILDLRGNTGGDDSFGFELARVLFGAEGNVNLPTPQLSRTFFQTPEAFALQANALVLSALHLKASGQPISDNSEQRRQEILSWMNRAKKHQFPEHYTERVTAPSLDQDKIFQPAVYILIDRNCASSCENTLQVLERLHERILVGENTAGAVEYGEVGKLLLKNSKVGISLSTMRVRFRDGRKIEKTGYAPAIQVKAGDDALTAALQQIGKP